MSKQDSQNQLMQPAAEHATIVSIHHPRVNMLRLSPLITPGSIHREILVVMNYSRITLKHFD
jgi:hypothetical protein